VIRYLLLRRPGAALFLLLLAGAGAVTLLAAVLR
jgi:ABC-type thiamin/hydroxymethylpyrimidine transport system permease subunit